ncbi:Transposon Tf2-9 polyprotein [Trichinella murrelli]|uniref:RNA-directed DNA polymerase n=1 Tax=Trichinella murrelli TaxID=144512 RepID=A0A0V0TYL4_9BILA|nr:Transposon Tf2-9 polyprotein [Trichinella murrelli]
MAETQHVLATRMGSLRLGHIEEFDTSLEWNSYASRLMFYLEANKVSSDADKRAVLLSSCSSALFKLVESLLSPAKPVERSFDEIISVLNDHFAPQPSEIVNRHIFYQRKQQPGETVAEFIADLRRLAQDCNFLDLETMLRDRLEEALSAEAACKHACEVRAVNVDSSAPNIHHMSSKRQTYKQANVMLFAGVVEKLVTLNACVDLNKGAPSLRLKQMLSHIEGKRCQLEVDSESDVTIISEQTFEDLRNNDKKLKLAPMTLSLVSFLGKQVKLMGSCFVNVDYSIIHTRLRIFVAKGNCPNLLGLEWFKPLGIRIEGEPVSLDLDPSVLPVRMKARKVPLALKEKIDMELDKLVKQKVLEPVSHPVWATPIVTPMKADGSLRICVAHLLASLAGGKVFAKLDLAQTYQQLVVDKKTADAQTIITHRGAFRVKRLQFGVSAAPGIFQGVIDQLTIGIPGVLPYFDDILIAAKDESMLAKRLATLLKRFYGAGLRLNAEKCKFCLRRIEFLGFDIDASGIHPSKQKVAAIHNTPQPRNKKELQTFLGLLNFYHSFLRNKATVAEPIHWLLDKETKWKWTKKHKKAFNKTKQLLSSDCVLTHYDVKNRAVLCHQMPNGKEAPIAFYSRTLTSTERNYAQIDKEALAIIASVKKFHDYLYGCSFRIITDHKPLLGIFAPNKEIPYILSPRMLRWTVMLGAYVYDVCYRPGKLIANADILSRLPIKVPDVEISQPLEVLMWESDDTVIMKANDIARMSLKDPLISRVLNWAWKGWPAKLSDKNFKPFFIRQLEISVHKGCLLWGNRVVIPIQAHSRLLTMLHDGHPGIVRMKALARSYFWWPKMDEDIEKTVNTCDVCHSSRAAMPKAPVHSWEKPNNPWSRLHIDFAAPFQGKTFLIVVDTFSKWLEVIPISEMSTRTVIEELQILEKRCYPASNGQAERMVRTAKEALRKMVHGSWKQRLANFLFLQCVSPCATTGKSPTELLMKRRLRTVLDRIHPDIEVEAIEGNSDVTKPDKQKIRIFAPDDLVFARNYEHGPKWCPATIVAPTGPVFYKVRTTDGQLWKHHLDQLRKRHPSIEVTEDTETDVNKTQQSNIADNSSESEQEDCQQLMEKSPSAVVEPIAERIPEPITETIAEQPTRPPRTRRKPKSASTNPYGLPDGGLQRQAIMPDAYGIRLEHGIVGYENCAELRALPGSGGVAADELTRRSVFSYCGKLVAHFPVCRWLRIAATYIKRKANDATTSWDEVIEAVEAKVWVDASSQAVGVALEIGGSVVEDVAWLSLDDAQHINMAELDAVIKGFNMVFSWQITKIRLMTDSATVHQWVTDGLSRKTRLRTKATGEMLIRRKVGIVLLLVEEFVLELYVELVRSANNKADELTRVPRQ